MIMRFLVLIMFCIVMIGSLGAVVSSLLSTPQSLVLLFVPPPNLEIVTVMLSSSSLILCTVYIPPACGESYLLSVIEYLSDLVYKLQQKLYHCR